MSQVALSGQDTVVINSQIIRGFGDGDYVVVTFPNPIAAVKTGKNGNSIYAYNASGQQADCKIKVLRGSDDDKFLQNLLTQQNLNFAGTVLMTAQFVKKVGDGQGNITSDTYILSGGVFVKQVEGKSNAEGDTEQSQAIYEIKFSNSPRVLT